ncbi:TetR family transcriptional regulator [Actinomadura pelletieri DSM 43383]|uniref:TetR family transcriptional regulator n=1 Tax=Actinomadura pelletieri DSM 43383 TaxID=1120940 RepID=A0A495QX95_9ACTN|nr:TetR/AcrR family transcriptional regulator [Actinomadura pelletieri]RKS78697.1 TetR family transcriptional regulator [Actinomadura pelletieri DSM 43383]
MPPTNLARRQALSDAAIDLLAASGVHGVTHRAVEKQAGLPVGTASNYFRSREALLVAATERVVELHMADMEQAAEHPPPGGADLVEMLTESLFTAATTLRDRYIAIFELQLEAVRRPALAAALAKLQETAVRFTADQHDRLGLKIAHEKVPALIALYGSALFALVSAPPGTVTRPFVKTIVDTMVHGTAVSNL